MAVCLKKTICRDVMQFKYQLLSRAIFGNSVHNYEHCMWWVYRFTLTLGAKPLLYSINTYCRRCIEALHNVTTCMFVPKVNPISILFTRLEIRWYFDCLRGWFLSTLLVTQAISTCEKIPNYQRKSHPSAEIIYDYCLST